MSQHKKRRIVQHRKIRIMSGVLAIILLSSMSEFITKEVYAPSPAFSRQTIIDGLDDWSYMGIGSVFPFDQKVCAEHVNNFSSPDIAAVDYFSNGEFLNATLWLSSSIEPPVPPAIKSFQMLIDVGSVYDTGQDYLLKIDWNSSGQNWYKTLQDMSPSPGKNGIIDVGEYRVLENQNYNNTSFYEVGKNYVELNTAMQNISSPDQYSIVFIVSNSFYTENNYFCNVVDISDRVHIPPPDVAMSMSPSSVALYPDEEKSTELRLKSTTKLDSNVILHTNKIDDVASRFIPNEIYVPSSGGITVSHLHIKTTKYATPGIYAVPVFADITFPTALSNQLSNQIANNSVSASIVKYANFTVTILEPLTITEQFGSIWNEVGVPVSGLVSLIVALVGGISTVIVIISKKRLKDKYANSHGID